MTLLRNMYDLKDMFDMEINLLPLDWSYAVIDTPANCNTSINLKPASNLHLTIRVPSPSFRLLDFDTGAK